MDLGTIQYNVEANTTGLNEAETAMDAVIDKAEETGVVVDSMSKKITASATAASSATRSIKNDYGSLAADLRRQADLYGETSQAAKLRYDIEQGALADLTSAQKAHLITLAQNVDSVQQAAIETEKLARAERELSEQAQMSAMSLDKQAQSIEAALAREIALYGEVGRAAKLAYEMQHGALKGLTNEQKQSINAMAKHLDMLDAGGNAAIQNAKATEAQATAFRGLRGQAQNLGWQLQDVAVQLQAGTSAFTVFSQQGSQLVSTMGKNGPLLGAIIAVGGAIGGVLFSSLMTTGKAMEDMADRAKELAKEMDNLTEAQKGVVQAAIGYTIRDQEKEIKKTQETIDSITKSIAELNEENGRVISSTTGYGATLSVVTDNTLLLESQQKKLTATQLLLIEQQKILSELQGGKDDTKNKDMLDDLKKELDLIGLKGEALHQLAAAQKGLSGLDAYAYIQTQLNIDAANARIEAEKNAAKEKEDAAKKAIDAEKQRADSIQKMTEQLAKEAALMGNTSKEAEIRYGLSNGLIQAYGAEAYALIRNAQAIDAQREAMNRANVEAGLMADFESALGKENAQMAELDAFSESVENFGGAWDRTGSIIVDAFGGIAEAMDDYSSSMVAIAKKEKELGELKRKYADDPAALKKLANDEINLEKQKVKTTISGYATMAGAAASMFDEQSKERKALNNAEKVFTAIEIGLAMQKASANALTAITSAFAAPFPVNFASGAAMIAIMAGLGVFGGGGGGGGPSAADIQESQGTGTVLGSDDKSGSIVNALESYSDIGIDQLSELRGIRGAMQGLTAGIAQLAIGFVAGGQFKGAGVSGLGTTQALSVGDFAGKEIYDFLNPLGADILNRGLKDLFGTTTKKLKDSGLQFGAQDLGDILAGELEADYYNTIQTTKKKLYGLSKKKSTKDELIDVDTAAADEITRIFDYMSTAVNESVSSLGLMTEKSLNDFAISIGKVSFKDLSGEEIQSELEAIFSQQADLMAEYLMPQISMYQQMGEGAFETLTRVAQQQAVFNDAMDNMGLSMAGVSSIMAIDMAQSIAEMMGGFEKFTEAASGYIDKFFDDSEKFGMLQNSLAEAFGSLNVEMPGSIAGFRSLVEGIDRTTIEGQRLFASLLEISPAFAEYVEQIDKAGQSIVDSSYAALQRSVNAEKSIIADQVAILNSALSASKSTFSALQSSLNGMAVSSDRTLAISRRNAQAQLGGFLESARAGALPSAEDLRGALEVIGRPSQVLFTSFEDFALDAARTAATIKELQDITGEQISSEERALQELKDQSSYLDEMVTFAKEQIEILNGVDNSVISLVDAMNNFASTIGVQLPTIQQLTPEQLSSMNTRTSESVAEKIEAVSVKQQQDFKKHSEIMEGTQIAIVENSLAIRKLIEKFDKIGMPKTRDDA